jgi:hypothetical protein
MTLMEAAIKWKLSPNWVRELIKSKRIPSKLVKTGPVAYYEIPDGTPRPQSMQRSPARKGSTKKVKPEAIARRAWRAEKAKEREAKKAARAAAKAAKKS